MTARNKLPCRGMSGTVTARCISDVRQGPPSPARDTPGHSASTPAMEAEPSGVTDKGETVGVPDGPRRV